MKCLFYNSCTSFFFCSIGLLVSHMIFAFEVDSGNALPDSLLAWKHLYPGSMPADGQVPSDAEEVARRAAASAVLNLCQTS